MTDTLSRYERTLDATEEILRRYGAEKTSVVDVARILGMSHSNIYRHSPSKRALLDALRLARQNKVRRDPELFQVYRSAVGKSAQGRRRARDLALGATDAHHRQWGR